ncbi:SUMF1/EgtB/PvdO family nonheme iron enzyme [Oerskovia sp. M15]
MPAAPRSVAPGLLPGGPFRMGSTEFYPDEAPVHEAVVGAFEIEQHP